MKLLLIALLILISSSILTHELYAKSSEEKKITSALKTEGYKNICKLGVTTKINNQSKIIYDNPKCTTVQPPIPPNPTPGTAIPSLNKTKTVRIGVVGDVDNNAGLVTQLNLFKKYQVQYLIIPGDFGYSSGQGVIDKLTAAGFTKSNTEIVLGNHDSCTLIKSWSGSSACFGDRSFTDKIAVFSIDGNSNFGCGTTQYDSIKSDIETSKAMYKIPAIHQPFATVQSDHGPNGQYQCYQSLFSKNGVDLVLEAHNHNYNRFFLDPIVYLLVGTGTHDTGSGMYPIGSDNFEGNKCLKCFTGTNGVEILDLQIDKPNIRHIDGYFLSNGEKVMDTFIINH